MLLKSVSLVSLVFLGSVSFSTKPALADEHIVIILGSAYFPKKTTVEQGDTVRFVNVSGKKHTVFHTAGHWATHVIGEGEELLVTIEPLMEGEFFGMAKQRITGRLELQSNSKTH